MRINFCVPTRGKSSYVQDFLAETVRNIRGPATRVVLGVDEDEPEYDQYADWQRCEPKVIWSIAPREDSLGAKFNRCAAAYDADLYVMGVDDLAIQEAGWDMHLAEVASKFQDGPGVVTFGKQWNEPMPAFQAVTKAFVAIQGFFMAPYFPFWWHDTWNLEMAALTDRHMHFDCPVRTPTMETCPSYSRRDVHFWATFFDRTRQQRCDIADRILEASDEPPWRLHALKNRREDVCAALRAQQSKLLNPIHAARFEEGSIPDHNPERHERLKARARL